MSGGARWPRGAVRLRPAAVQNGNPRRGDVESGAACLGRHRGLRIGGEGDKTWTTGNGSRGVPRRCRERGPRATARECPRGGAPVGGRGTAPQGDLPTGRPPAQQSWRQKPWTLARPLEGPLERGSRWTPVRWGTESVRIGGRRAAGRPQGGGSRGQVPPRQALTEKSGPSITDGARSVRGRGDHGPALEGAWAGGGERTPGRPTSAISVTAWTPLRVLGTASRQRPARVRELPVPLQFPSQIRGSAPVPRQPVPERRRCALAPQTGDGVASRGAVLATCASQVDERRRCQRVQSHEPGEPTAHRLGQRRGASLAPRSRGGPLSDKRTLHIVNGQGQ